MNALNPFVVFAAGVLAFLLAALFARLAGDAKFLAAEPNNRSSHARRVSAAGGLAIMIGWVAAMLAVVGFGGAGEGAGQDAARLLLLGLFALGLGLADDRWELSAAAKFGGQMLLALLFVLFFTPLSSAPLPFLGDVTLGLFGAIVTIFWIVAFMNAFNFMDGANGLASGTAAFGLCVAAFIMAIFGTVFWAAAAVLLAAALFGFFPRNFFRGAIFMGDGGSQSVSFLIAALAVIGAETGPMSFLAIPMIFLPLIVDVTFTLAHRAKRGQPLASAHREHCYQLLLRSGRSHREVAIFYIAATAFCSAGALLMVTAPPEGKWLFPAVTGGLLAGVAVRVYRAAARNGLLADAVAPSSHQEMRVTEVSTRSASATE